MSDLITDFYADADALRLDDLIERFDADAVVVFGSAPAAVGRDAIREGLAALFGQLDGMRHEILHRWSPEENMTVLEAVCHYLPTGTEPVPVPVVSVVEHGDGGNTVAALRVYIDLAPLFTAIAAAAPAGATA